VTRLNRPGLDALGYRVGTHASFLETMKARLSNLELPPELFEAGASPTPQQTRPLLSLTTRVSSDPSIAMLDAWATVADVLTFYQERIANEGFLLTATERRSILELARLVGYRLRPGVAASVYFAYTLEKNSVVEIPAGARAQSVPGPGELPQSFETSDKLPARSEWNTLQVRLTRPQTLGPNKAIYFKGINTKLKPNDPLLFDFGDNRQEVLRVLTVEPDQANGRTKVDAQPWDGTSGPLRSAIPGSMVERAPMALPDSINSLQEILGRLKRAEGFEVNTGTQTAQRVISQLEEVEKKIEAATSNVELKQSLDEALPSLREDHRLATEGNFTKLLPWIDAVVSELQQASDRVGVPDADVSENGGPELFASLDAASTSKPRFAVTKGQSANAGTTSSLTDVIALIGDLEKPVSQPPASSRQLGRSVAGSFSAASDALPKLLATINPALGDVLYRAWENLPVSAPLPVSVYALRTQASVFGNAAPPKQITNKETGAIEGYEEWTLFTVTEQLRIEISQPGGLQANMTTKITIDRPRVTVTGSSTQVVNFDKPTSFDLKLSNQEVVSIDIPNPTPPTELPTSISFRFQDWNLTVIAERAGQQWTLATKAESTATRKLRKLTPTGNSASLMIDGDLAIPTELPNRVSLDNSHKEITPGSWAVLDQPLRPKQTEPKLLITKILSVRELSRADYAISGSGTQLELSDNWINPDTDQFNIIRGTRVFAQSELLELAEEPIPDPVCGTSLELDSLVSGLDSGRWLIVSGERTDIKHVPPDGATRQRAVENQIKTAFEIMHVGEQGTEPNTPASKDVLPGVTSSELVMLAGVEQGYDKTRPGDTTHTTLILSTPLAYCYKRETLTIYGNVVNATHGETKTEVLGSGDGSQELQQFDLRQSPLTYISAATPAGAESTLQVRVDDVLWHETDNLIGLGPKDRRYITSTDDKDQTTVEFGNGKYGARLSTGVENVKAVYRTGIGKPGNVKARQITSVVTKPLGVKEVINPFPATGGADREDRDQARRNIPIAVMALDRLVSVQDYEDFARTYAGIAKASSARLSDGSRELVHLTIAGSDDIPIATTSDLFKNLNQALRQFGDPYQNIQVVIRKLKVLVISAKVRLLPDYLWEAVEPKIRAALIDKFSFARRELGQDALSSEALSAMQAQTGVAYVDLDVFDAIDEDVSPQVLAKLGSTLKLQPRILVNKAKVARHATDPARRILAGELAYLNPAVADTLILTELGG
jgi:hypothetical protein